MFIENGEMRQGSFSINSVIITDVRRDDRGGLMLLVNRSLPLDSSAELASLLIFLFIYIGDMDDARFVLRRPSRVSFVCSTRGGE